MQKNYKYPPKVIKNVLERLITEGRFGDGFTFRKSQKSIVMKIAFIHLNQIHKNIIVDAPTGSGKSIICIAAAKLINEFQHKSYILTSNLDLQDQYKETLNELNTNWGSVKGMDNYMCEVNGKRFREGECRIRAMSLEKAQELDCYNDCGYYRNRAQAINSKTSVLNYSYWLLQMNYVNRKAESDRVISFPEREITFCDEAHKIDDIVQNHFNFILTQERLDQIVKLAADIFRAGFISDGEPDLNPLLGLHKLIVKKKNDVKTVRKYLKILLSSLEIIIESKQHIEARIKKQYPMRGGFDSKNKIPKNWNTWLGQIQRCSELFCKIEDYDEILEQEPRNLIVDHNQKTDVLTFYLLKERELVQSKLHEWTGTGVFLSATFGNVNTWAKLTGTEDYKVLRMQPDWDWSESPIIHIGGASLNYKSINKDLPKAIKKVDEVLDLHEAERGIIHTVNYSLVQELLKRSKNKKRFLTYGNSKERAFAVKRMSQMPGAVLIGPSLIEGLDLKDELSRFQIFLKVPYRQLVDAFTQAKLKDDQLWYNWKTAVQFIQGLGRSKRSTDDWCRTYLIDDGFKTFLSYNMELIPESIQERIKFQ